MFDHLFKPISVNGMILKNRIIATPTGDDFEEKARWGAALVIAGHAIVEPGRSSFASPEEPYPFAKYEREETRKKVLKIHRGGAKASVEIFHAGQDARTVDYAKGPSALIRPDGVEVKEMDRVRKVIADHMVMSKHTSPHVTNVVEVDVTKLVKWRDKNKDAFFRREGVKLTYMPVITEAVAKALAAYPQVNVSVDGYNILFKKHINVGIAVSLNDGNLIVTVVHDADHLNLNGLAVAIDSLALKARDNKLMPEDIDGGTFTITNFGTFKSLFGTPIINQPQVAILGVGYIEKKPAVVETPEGDTIAIRHKMYLSLSYDHRVVDGMLGGNFLHFIADYLENWKG